MDAKEYFKKNHLCLNDYSKKKLELVKQFTFKDLIYFAEKYHKFKQDELNDRTKASWRGKNG